MQMNVGEFTRTLYDIIYDVVNYGFLCGGYHDVLAFRYPFSAGVASKSYRGLVP